MAAVSTPMGAVVAVLGVVVLMKSGNQSGRGTVHRSIQDRHLQREGELSRQTRSRPSPPCAVSQLDFAG